MQHASLPPPAIQVSKRPHVSKSSSTPNADAAETSTATPPDFEGSLAELEAIVDRLEQGELSLDESLQQFERGVQLTRQCQSALKQAEHKVEILLRKSGTPDEFSTTPFEAEDDEH